MDTSTERKITVGTELLNDKPDSPSGNLLVHILEGCLVREDDDENPKYAACSFLQCVRMWL